MQRASSFLLVCCLALAGCPGEKAPSDGALPSPPGEETGVVDPPRATGDVAQPATLSSGEGADSPADCFYRMKRAYDGKEFEEYYDVLSPDSREKMLPMLAVFCGLVTGGSEQAMDQYKQLLAEHGLEDLGEKGPAGPGQPARGEGSSGAADEGAPAATGMDFGAMAKEFEVVKDKRALFADLFAFLTKNKDRLGDTEKVVGLEGLKIEGDSASGMLILRDERGNEKRDPAEFRKIDGRWYAHVSMGQ